MATIDVLDAAGATQTVGKYLPGRAGAAASAPAVLSTEDLAALNAVTTAVNSLISLVNGTDAQLPATLGQKTAAGSLSMVLASDQGGVPVSGPLTDAQLRATAVPVSGAVALDAGTLAALETIQVGNLPADPPTQTTLAALLAKVIAAPATEAKQDTGNTSAAAVATGMGAPADSAATTDAGTFSLLALFKRLLGKIPALGQATAAASQPVVIASDQSAVAVKTADATATGNVTTQNLVPAGAATAGSAVEIAINGQSAVGVQVTGTYTGALTAQGTIDGTNWITIGGVPLQNVNTGAQSATITSATVGIFMLACGGFNKVRITGLAAMTGTAAVSLRAAAVSALVALGAALPTGTNTLGAVNIAAAQTLATVTTVSTVSNVAAIAAGTNAIGDVGIQVRANATGAATPLSVLSPATPAATTCKAGAGRLLGISLTNTSASVRSVKFWNLLIGSVTIGTTAALFEVDIPAGGVLQIQWPYGIGFSTGISFAITGAKGLSDNTAITLNDVTGLLVYA